MDIVPALAQAYTYVFDLACNNDMLFRHVSEKSLENQTRAREFFGLRDFYRFI